MTTELGKWCICMGTAIIIGALIVRYEMYREKHREEREANDGIWPLAWRKWQ